MVSPVWVAPFIEALRKSGVVAHAARAAGVSYSAVYAHRAQDADFAAAWDDALEESYDELEAELLRRAHLGVDEPVIYQGQPTYVFERDAQGAIVMETYGQDANGASLTRPKLLLDAAGNPVVLTVNKKSDALLMFALKGRRKGRYADRTEHTGADGGPVKTQDETKIAARTAALLAMAAARKAKADAEAKLAQDFGDLA